MAQGESWVCSPLCLCGSLLISRDECVRDHQSSAATLNEHLSIPILCAGAQYGRNTTYFASACGRGDRVRTALNDCPEAFPCGMILRKVRPDLLVHRVRRSGEHPSSIEWNASVQESAQANATLGRSAPRIGNNQGVTLSLF